jgi:hypothetical protein
LWSVDGPPEFWPHSPLQPEPADRLSDLVHSDGHRHVDIVKSMVYLVPRLTIADTLSDLHVALQTHEERTS